MPERFSHLLSPGFIGKVEIPNRLVSAPMGSAMASDGGFVTPRLLSYYAEKAKGGAGLIIVEATYTDNIVSKAEENQLGAHDTSCGAGLALLATVMHDWGVKCAVQLCHGGEQLYLFEKYWSAAPSDGVGGFGPLSIPLRGLTKEEIKEVIQSHAQAALRVKLAGFDMVEIHAAHGHLFCTFLSPGYNRRTDEYGGSLQNRARIIIETIQAIQQLCGPDFPILVRLTGRERLPEGVPQIALEESIATAKMLEEAGAAAISLSGGSNKNQYVIIPTYEALGTHVDDAQVFKEAGVKIPLIVAGSITTPALAEDILSQSKSDFIAVGRPLVADPYWIKKLETGAPEDIKPCIRCTMGCVGTIEDFMSGRGIRCDVNPRAALEDMRKAAPLEKKKKIAIIGGGPGGMEAACLATLRGHDVTLYEKRKVGGALHEAAWDRDLKPDMQILLDYYLTQIKKLKIKVVEQEATVEMIVNGGFDAAIVATGAGGPKYAQVKKTPGYGRSHVYTELEVTGGEDIKLGETIIVAGGGEIAAEIAASQAMKGKKVSLVAPEAHESMIANNASFLNQMSLMSKLDDYNVLINVGMTLKEITDDGAIFVDLNGEEHKLEGDSVVICAGFTPDMTLANALKGKVKEVRAIGDCVNPRGIGDAINEGWLAANQI